MKVKLLTDLIGPKKKWRSGEEHEVSDNHGKRLVEKGIAEEVKKRGRPKKNEEDEE